MNKKELEQQLETLRKIYPTASPQQKLELEKEAKQIKHQLGSLCYECKENVMTEIHLPFCSTECHEKYADRELQPKKGEQKSIQYMQKRLKEIGRGKSA